jgi:predicted AAA+ superfamily ATPase
MGDLPEPSPTSGDPDLDAAILGQSPWVESGEVPLAWAPTTERTLARVLWSRVLYEKPHRFQLILGPRRVGKTVCMYQTARRLIAAGVPGARVRWLQLDHPLLRGVRLDILVRHAVEHARATHAQPLFLFLDELAVAKEWDAWLKSFHDGHWPVRIVASSSAAAALGERTESGIGRWDDVFLGPCLLDEQLDLAGVPARIAVEGTLAETLARLDEAEVEPEKLSRALEEHLLIGGFPGLVARGEQRLDPEQRFLRAQEVLRRDAIEGALYRDIPQSCGVDDPALLEKLLYLLAGEATGILSPQSICKDMHGLAQPTFDRYLSFLERSFLVFTAMNYSATERGTQKRGRKLYFVDGAARNATLRRGLAPIFAAHERALLLENAAAAHVYGLCRATQLRPRYWRERLEVDIVYPHPSAPCAFEVGRSADHARAGLRAIGEAFRELASQRYLVAPKAPLVRPRASKDGIGSIPLGLFLLAVGRQSAQALLGGMYPEPRGAAGEVRERRPARAAPQRRKARSKKA